MKQHFLIYLSLVSVLQAFSQKNVSKFSVFPETKYRVFGIAQERTLTRNISVQSTIRYMPLTRIEEAKYAAGSFKKSGTNPFSNTCVRALGNVTEIKIYRRKRKSTKGFYWGPFFSMNAYNISTSNFTINFKVNSKYVFEAELKQSARVTTFGGGLQVGIQALINKHLSFDWTILGLGLGRGALIGRIELINPPADVDIKTCLLNFSNAEFAFEKTYPLQKTVSENVINVSGKGMLPVIRTSLSIGIAY